MPQIEGVAALFVLRTHAWAHPDRLVRSGQWASFDLPGSPATPVLRGRIEGLDPHDDPLEEGAGLTDGSRVRLRAGRHGGFVYFEGPGSPSLLVIRKADVPDQTRPTTCDERLRDGDFVFLRTVSPSIWIGLSARGTGPPVPVAAPADRKKCVRDREICRTDRGGPVCAWAPDCSR